MRDVGYVQRVFRQHIDQAAMSLSGATLLELGPGDSVLTGVLARLLGADRTWLVDSGNFAERAIEPYQQAVDAFVRDLPSVVAAVQPAHWRSFDDLLEDCRISYATDGLQSLRTIPTGAVDFSFSQAVLEHVRRGDFAATMQELRRVSKPGARSSHEVDLRDHLGGGLNNLRFRAEVWESDTFVRSGFYTNRLRRCEMLDAMQAAGWRVQDHTVHLWDEVPLARDRMDAPFREWPNEELRIRIFTTVLQAT
jgi:SAM-dependent methyltransferase